MSNTFDAQLKTQLAKNFVNQFSSFSNDKFYVAISRIKGDGSSERTEAEELVSRNNTVIAKRVNPQDGASLLVERNDWTYGTIYQKLDSELDMSTVTRPFYAMNNDRNVYICLENAAGSTGSSIQPTGTSTDPIILSDGYSWKFLYSVPEDLRLFEDDNFIPVKTLPVYDRIPNAYQDNRQNQYAVQYEGSVSTSNGTIQAISIVSDPVNPVFTDGIPQSQNNIVTSAGANTNTMTIGGVPISGNLSEADFGSYYIRILSGVAVGQVRKIVRNNAGTLILAESWTSGKVPSSGDRFEIGVGITVSGDGTGALAFGKLSSSGTLASVVIYANGSRYTTASAVVDTTTEPEGRVSPSLTNSAGYEFDVLLFSPIGKDPAVELNARHAAFLVRLSGSEPGEDAILGNDFRDVILWKNPEIGTGEINEGKIAGFDDFLSTRVIISEPSETETLLPLELLQRPIIAVGQDSNIAAQIDGDITIDQNNVSGSFRAIDLRKGFFEDEIINFVETERGAFKQADKTAKIYVTRFGDSDLQISKTVYVCTTILDLEFSANGNYAPSLDAGATGASGSSGLIARYQESSANSAKLSLTDIKNISGVTLGFRVGETVDYPLSSGGIVTGTITGVQGPELDLFSGEMPYIKGLTQGVTRVVEQDEIFKFIFEF